MNNFVLSRSSVDYLIMMGNYAEAMKMAHEIEYEEGLLAAFERMVSETYGGNPGHPSAMEAAKLYNIKEKIEKIKT